jgi:hypothetical protein
LKSEASSRRTPATRPALLWCGALAAIAAFLAFGLHHLPDELSDFEVYWRAAVRTLRSEPLYRVTDAHWRFKYLPGFAVLVAPVGMLSLASAKAVWFVFSAALVPALIALSIALLPQQRRSTRTLAFVAVIAMGKFLANDLGLGQVNVLFADIVCGAILATQRGRDLAAGVLIVLATAVKPYAVVFLPWLAVTRGRRALAAGAAAFVVLLALPLVFYGVAPTVELHREWWKTVTESTASTLTNPDNMSLSGMFSKWLGAGAAASSATIVTSAALVVLAVLVIALGRRLPRREPLEGALLLTLIPLLSPQGWDYVFLIATPAVVLFANYDDRLPSPLRWTTWIAVLVAGLSIFDLMGRARYTAFMSWSVITCCFLVVTAALALLRGRRIV